MYPVRISGYFDMLGKCQKAYSRQLEPVCRRWELTRSEMDVVLFLYNNPEYDRAADIVSHRGMAKSHVSLSVATLEEKGLLRKEYTASDRRTAHLRLTETGAAIAAQGREAQQKFFDQLYDGLTGEELAIWENLAGRVRDNIEKIDG